MLDARKLGGERHHDDHPTFIDGPRWSWRGAVVAIGVGMAFGGGFVIGGLRSGAAMATTTVTTDVAAERAVALAAVQQQLGLRYGAELAGQDSLTPTPPVAVPSIAAAVVPPSPTQLVPTTAPTMASALAKIAEPTKPVVTPASKAGYSIQVASMPLESTAKQVVAQLQQKGMKATIVTATIPGKGTVHRVRVSGFASRAAAEAGRAKLGQGMVVSDAS
jgi:cell division septation protein DedD